MPRTELLSKLCPASAGNSNRSRLTLCQRICYGVGHIFNDLCANCWFSYLLIYMTKVVGLSNNNAGIVLLIGQVADAIFTPFIGYGCDKTHWKKYGRRKLWHAIGSACVITSFPFVFNLCLNCKHAEEVIKVLYYSGFVVVFQFGWASVQISHLSLIPEIAGKLSEKVELNAIRSGLTFVCGIYVFGVIWLLLGSNSEENVTPAVATEFTYLTIVVVITGGFFSLVFHIGTNEPKQVPVSATADQVTEKFKQPVCNSSTGETGNESECKSTITILDRKCAEQCKTWKEWFKCPLFYKMAIVYMCTRLTVNVSQSYLVLYLTDTLDLKKEAIAYFPLLVLISGVVASFGMKFLNKKIGSKITYICGCLFVVGACGWFFSLSRSQHDTVYAAAVLMGAGTSVMLVTSLTMTADLIGSHKSSGAFVYSAMSFTDKLSSGVVIAIIQALKPESLPKEYCASCAEFTKFVQAVVPGGSAICALLCVALFFPSEFVLKKKICKADVATQTEDCFDEPDNVQDSENINVDGDAKSGESDDKTELLHQESCEDIESALKRLSWHSSMTSYVAWRLASPHLPSPVPERHCKCPNGTVPGANV